jgi:MinD-like ATPase involved in chromosome partitioning or flagellar assembly
MFCCTFYSYKGGVGRTLALANVAIEHARLGKKVLVVDFDLEAPGLSTLAPFDQAADSQGLIDFVEQYQISRAVPDVSKYIYTCKFQSEAKGFSIDVMPAGCGSEGYSEAYSAIDWNSLYESDDGFLFMEDMRAQWEALKYDYVYIDSRTGHTDSGGICTRQLPDAVAVVFFPNAQNLRGLKETVPAIRASEGRPKAIETLFVASRVPRLDDEHDLLKNLLSQFSECLKYSEDDLVVIEQYDSLSLLDQELFILTRPTSGLARQYRQVAEKISEINVEDADGAYAYLQSVLDGTRRPFESVERGDVNEIERIETSKLGQIREAHENDALIQFLLARVFYFNRDLVEAAIASDKVIASQERTKVSAGIPEFFVSNVHHLRLRVFSELKVDELIRPSAIAVIRSEKAEDTAILDAMMALATSAPDELPSAKDLPALEGAEPRRLLSVARRLMSTPKATELAGAIVEKTLEKAPRLEGIRSGDITDIQLPLIATGRFELAYIVYEQLPADKVVRLDVLFNSAMAKWGRDREPDLEMFEEVLRLFRAQADSDGQPNHSECRALIEGLLGYIDDMKRSLANARKLISHASHIEFSCWNYLNVSPEEFKRHLTAIEDFIVGEGSPPEFLRLG